MKYCTKCGAQMVDDAVICVNCGCAVETATAPAPSPSSSEASMLKTVAKIFMVLGCVVSGIYLIPLCWTIPMTVHYFKAVKESRPVGLAFKICSLLFVSLVGGILMLCDNDKA